MGIKIKTFPIEEAIREIGAFESSATNCDQQTASDEETRRTSTEKRKSVRQFAKATGSSEAQKWLRPGSTSYLAPGNAVDQYPREVRRSQDILLANHHAGLDATGTSALIPGIVTVESWYPEALIAHLIQEELQKTGVEAGRFQLMSISDLEWLLTWAQIESPAVVLRDKLSDPTQDDVPLREYLSKRAKDHGQSFPQRILKERSDSFFDQLTGPDAQA